MSLHRINNLREFSRILCIARNDPVSRIVRYLFSSFLAPVLEQEPQDGKDNLRSPQIARRDIGEKT